MAIDWVGGHDGRAEEMNLPLKSMSPHIDAFASSLRQEQRAGTLQAMLVFEVKSIGAETLIELFGAGFTLDTVGDYYILGAKESFMQLMLAGEAMQSNCSGELEFAKWWEKTGSLPIVASRHRLFAFGHIQMDT